jgi:hypothetical protein
MTATIPAQETPTLPAAIRDLFAARGLGDAPVRFAEPTSTRLDTGGWLRGGQVWAAIVGDRFVLAAAGPRPLLIQLPVAALSRAVYNHVTGELALPPISAFPRVPASPPGPSGAAIPPVRLDPLVARSLVSLATPPTPSSPGNPSDA